MPIWIAIPYLLLVLVVIGSIGYTMVRWWKWWVIGGTALFFEYTFLQGAIGIWRSIFILKGIA